MLRIFPARRDLAAGAIALCALGGAASAAPAFVPDAQVDTKAAASAPRLSGSTWIAEQGAVTLRVQLVDDADRLRYLEHVTKLPVDPFASPPGKEGRFLNFAVELENRDAGSVSFNPRDVWLHDDRSPGPAAVFGISDLASAYRLAELEFPAAYEHAERAVLEQPVVVAAGGTLRGLLIYRDRSPKARRLRLTLNWTAADGTNPHFDARWIKPPEPKR